ncbi:MAG: hypothetical protein KatS3mg032_0305 [Cyclobacteriaceae bacterium]|nr:MAG: hypothetical protein KatS3mg032_0305 [Cyclobacteriaceae bacterium]
MRFFNRLISAAVVGCIALYSGCSSGNDPSVTNCSQSDLQLAVASTTNPTDCITGNGMIVVEATGGKPPYQFRLNAGSFGSSASFSGLGAGTFTITVKDQQGCEKEVLAELVLNTGLMATMVTQAPNSKCLAPYNGSVTVAASGGSGNYQYAIDGGPFGNQTTFNELKDGLHTVTVKDLSDNCTFSLSVSIDRLPTGVTFNGQIKALFEAKCSGISCHPANGDLFTYSTAFGKRQEIKNRTQSGDMPRTGSLTSDEKALIACWVDDGAPEN